MVIGLLIKLFLSIAARFVSLLPVIDVEIPTEFVATLSSLLLSISYFLPVNYLIFIFTLSIQVEVFFIMWRLFLRAKSFVPMWGN